MLIFYYCFLFIKILGNGGIPNLYRGALYYATVDGCSGAIFFSTYEFAKRHLNRYLPEKFKGASGYICSIAGLMAASVVLVPGELIKQRLQTGQYGDLLQCLRLTTSASNGGIRGLYTGFRATIVRDLPYFAIQLGCYGSFRLFHIFFCPC